jgi:hypothetical protein
VWHGEAEAARPHEPFDSGPPCLLKNTGLIYVDRLEDI